MWSTRPSVRWVEIIRLGRQSPASSGPVAPPDQAGFVARGNHSGWSAPSDSSTAPPPRRPTTVYPSVRRTPPGWAWSTAPCTATRLWGSDHGREPCSARSPVGMSAAVLGSMTGNGQQISWPPAGAPPGHSPTTTHTGATTLRRPGAGHEPSGQVELLAWWAALRWATEQNPASRLRAENASPHHWQRRVMTMRSGPRRAPRAHSGEQACRAWKRAPKLLEASQWRIRPQTPQGRSTERAPRARRPQQVWHTVTVRLDRGSVVPRRPPEPRARSSRTTQTSPVSSTAHSAQVRRGIVGSSSPARMADARTPGLSQLNLRRPAEVPRGWFSRCPSPAAQPATSDPAA